MSSINSVSINQFFKPQFIRNRLDLFSNIQLGKTTESITLDFKQEIKLSDASKGEKKKIAEEIALDICQFLNTWGGVLVVGVSEREDKERNKKVAHEFLGVFEYEKLSQFINDSALPLLHPKTISINVKCIEICKEIQIVTINVFPLVSGVAYVCDDKEPFNPKFPYRTHYGKRYLHPSEVERRMIDSHRIIPIKLQELIDYAQEVEIYPSVKREPIDKISRLESLQTNAILKEISNNEYRLNVNGVDINIPFSLTKDVWRTEKGKIGILLHVRLCLSSDRKSVFFDL